MTFKAPGLLIWASLLLCSCSYKQQHVLFEQKDQAEQITAAQTQPTPYHIKTDDVLQIRNLQDYKYLINESGAAKPDAASAQSYQVDEDGKVTLPVIGHVNVNGLTRSEAEKKIERLYRDSLLKNPIIELKILNLKVTILGEVKGQGNYPLTNERTTLVDIIGQAGGLDATADEKNIKIIRGGKGSQQIIWADLGNINTLKDPQIILQNDDIIYVAKNKGAIRNDKLQNFSTVVQPSLLILNTALILFTLFK